MSACLQMLIPCVWLAIAGSAPAAEPLPVAVDLTGYRADCGVAVASESGRLTATWPIGEHETGRLVLRLRPGLPLIESVGVSEVPILADADPAVLITVGSRQAGRNRPPGMNVFNEFFDNPATRPSTQHAGRFELRSARVMSTGRRATITLGELVAGPFRGDWRFTIYAGGRLVRVEAVVRTDEDRRAILYDAGLVWSPAVDVPLAWVEAEGEPHAEAFAPTAADRPIAVRHRAAALSGRGGSLVVSPPPHQFFFPRDFSDNVRTIWAGRDHGPGLGGRFGLGIRQDATGGGNYVPWFNARPGEDLALSMFLLLDRSGPSDALAAMRRYTRGDRFADLPGKITFTTHYHMAITVAAIKAQVEGRPPDPDPQWARIFKAMNVRAVHLGEFHGDGHQYDDGPIRLPELQAMCAECRRTSNADLLMIPGEEVSRFIGIAGPGRESGHWMTLFPKPVYWVLDRKVGRPFVEDDPRYGTVYHIRSANDVRDILNREGGLAWTAHPRIKSSSWAPDAFRGESYYRDGTWLGAAWKAMPADLSRERLGTRCLDLLDDMANWGGRKHMPGEVDIFKLARSHEIYAHMNINYLDLDKLPAFDEGWKPIVDVLRGGRFFTTTGEVLIRDHAIGGIKAGGSLMIAPGDEPELVADLEWTYPLRFAEVISGDGTRVFRERIELTDTAEFGRRTLKMKPDLRGRAWVRFEVWDVAANGAYTQPIWLDGR